MRCLAILALAAVSCAPARPQVLLLVTVDTLRADALGAYGSDLGLTPNLDALAARSLVFEAAYSAAPLTLPSLAALFTGRWPESVAVTDNESRLASDVPTLAAELRRAGWRTGAVVSNFVLNRSAGLAPGFDRYDDELPRREAVRRWPERLARETTDAALGLLDACAGVRCFVWVHYQDPHGPYDPPSGWRERELEQALASPDAGARLPVGGDQSGIGAIPAYQFLAGRHDVAYYRAGYFGEIAYVDEEIGRLLAGLAARGLADRAWVVFAADHGESLGERDVWFSHGELLSEEQVRVPLLLRAPGVAPARRADLASLVDLRPTLLRHVAGVAPDPSLPGRDLLAPEAARSASRPYAATFAASAGPRFALIEPERNLVASGREAAQRIELHPRGRDDQEIAGAEPETARRMQRQLEALRADLPRPEAPVRSLSPDERARLEALGYGGREDPPRLPASPRD